MSHSLEALKYTPPTHSPAMKKIGKKEIVYPERDGKPMSDNTKQFNWIVKIKEGLEVLFADNPDVFVAGDLLWYPVEGSNKIRIAPDAMTVFGRPKGDRGSYRQWEEGHIAPQVVFEVLSPGNTPKEMAKKLRFYERYGVEEYYEYDPDNIILKGWLRFEDRLIPIEHIQGWISPKLKIRFEISNNDLAIFAPDGQRFLSPAEMKAEAEKEKQRAEKILNLERKRAEKAEKRAEMLEAKLKMLEKMMVQNER